MLRLQWRKYRSKYPWLQMVQTWRFWVLVVFIVVMLVYAIASLRRASVTFLDQQISEIWLGNIEFDFLTGLYFMKEGKNVYLRGAMRDQQEMGGRPTHCAQYNRSQHLCASWYTKLTLEVKQTVEEHAVCQSITWTTWQHSVSNYAPQTCFSMSDNNWYGGSLFQKQMWPLNKLEVPRQPYTTHSTEHVNVGKNVVGSVLDWFWISSSGVAVIADTSFSLQISVNQTGDKLLCLYGKSTLKYQICKAKNLRKIQRFVANKFLKLPKRSPKEELFEKPLWSTYPLYKGAVNQANVMKYALDVQKNEFERSIMDIYDPELALFRTKTFDKNNFTNSDQMVMMVRGDYGFQTYVAVSPFVSVAENLDTSKLLVSPYHDDKPLVCKYNDKDVNVVNLVKPETFAWFVETLNTVKTQYGLDGLHLVGGDMDTMASCDVKSVYSGPLLDNDVLAWNVSSLANELQSQIIASLALRMQESAPLVLLTSSATSWDYTGGLKSVIPSVLTLGVLGYPFVIPNVIGGPGASLPSTSNKTSAEVKQTNPEVKQSVIPDRELYIRWLGLSAYMPLMMFSVPPWEYDQEVEKIAKNFTEIHKTVVAPLVIKAAREFEFSGSPIVRPLWWTDPEDAVSQGIDDQYLLGDSLMVAPILEPGQIHRDIFIPNGLWIDTINKQKVEGKSWLRHYKVAFNEVPTFVKTN